MATTAKRAIRPGVPTMLDIYCDMYMPWSPPGLKMEFEKNGVRNSANAIEHHSIMIVMEKNSLVRLMFLYARVNLRLTSMMNMGMKYDAMPKHFDTMKWDIMAPKEPHTF